MKQLLGLPLTWGQKIELSYNRKLLKKYAIVLLLGWGVIGLAFLIRWS